MNFLHCSYTPFNIQHPTMCFASHKDCTRDVVSFICVECICIPMSEMGGGGNGAVDLLVSRCKTCCDSVVSAFSARIYAHPRHPAPVMLV